MKGNVLNRSPSGGRRWGGAACGAGGRKGRALVQGWGAGGMGGLHFESSARQVL